jgi:RNA polymerase sigma-70 factor, ECF subfamily
MVLRSIGVNQMSKGNAVSDVKYQQSAEIWPRLYRYIYYKVQNREEAEELTQETCERVHPKIIARGIQEDKIEAYYFTTAKNLIAETWRKKVRQPATVSMDQLIGQGWEPSLPEQDTGLEDALIINKALQDLSDDYRLVLTLRIIEGWPVRAVAKKMKCSPGAVRSLQFRAVQALKEMLDEGGYFHEKV